MTDLETKTAELYGEIFRSFDENHFLRFQRVVSPEAFNEKPDFFQGKRVLELGCGGLGYSIASFLKYGASGVVAVDLSKENLKNLGKTFSKTENKALFVNADICNLPDDLGKFDMVYSYGVIHHTTDPKKAISGAYKALSRGGVFIIGLYGKGGLVSFLWDFLRLIRFVLPKKIILKVLKKYWRFGSYYVMDYVFVPILRRYSEKEAFCLLSKAGFTQIERLKAVPTIENMSKYFQQAQMDHESLLCKILHGTGWIILKGRKHCD